ncbi:MAG: ATP-binding protein, partial [Phycisphaerae bacterium]|nr:ATP-binding protein [Phycisphaerae bacterium]
CLAKVDPVQFQQAIMNLATNARDAMPNGGELGIRTYRADMGVDFAREHPGAAPGPYVVVAVGDTGIGMDARTQARIFDPFFTTKEGGKGTGLGLPMVYGFVKQSGGTIDVESKPGRGSEFRLYFPLADESVHVEVAVSAKEPLPRAHGPETILVVEDEAPVRRLLVAALRASGYEILEASDAMGAMLWINRPESRIDLLITDVVMPGMSGVNLAELARLRRRGLPVLYVSGYGGETLVGRGVDGSAAILIKPFTDAQLAKKVRQMLDTTPKSTSA